MSYSIDYCTKIFTLVVALFLFPSVSIPCRFAMVPDKYILQYHKKKRFTLPPEGTDEMYTSGIIFITDLNLCLPLHYYA